MGHQKAPPLGIFQIQDADGMFVVTNPAKFKDDPDDINALYLSKVRQAPSSRHKWVILKDGGIMANDGTKRYACTSYDDDTPGDPIDSSLSSCKWTIGVPSEYDNGPFNGTIKSVDSNTFWGIKKKVDKETIILTKQSRAIYWKFVPVDSSQVNRESNTSEERLKEKESVSTSKSRENKEEKAKSKLLNQPREKSASPSNLSATPSRSSSAAEGTDREKAGWLSAPMAIVTEKLDSPTIQNKEGTSDSTPPDQSSISDLTGELQTCMQHFVEENAKLQEEVRALREENGELKHLHDDDQRMITELRKRLEDVMNAPSDAPVKDVMTSAKDTLDHLEEVAKKYTSVDVEELLDHTEVKPAPKSQHDVKDEDSGYGSHEDRSSIKTEDESDGPLEDIDGTEFASRDSMAFPKMDNPLPEMSDVLFQAISVNTTPDAQDEDDKGEVVRTPMPKSSTCSSCAHSDSYFVTTITEDPAASEGVTEPERVPLPRSDTQDASILQHKEEPPSPEKIPLPRSDTTETVALDDHSHALRDKDDMSALSNEAEVEEVSLSKSSQQEAATMGSLPADLEATRSESWATVQQNSVPKPEEVPLPDNDCSDAALLEDNAEQGVQFANTNSTEPIAPDTVDNFDGPRPGMERDDLAMVASVGGASQTSMSLAKELESPFQSSMPFKFEDGQVPQSKPPTSASDMDQRPPSGDSEFTPSLLEGQRDAEREDQWKSTEQPHTLTPFIIDENAAEPHFQSLTPSIFDDRRDGSALSRTSSQHSQKLRDAFPSTSEPFKGMQRNTSVSGLVRAYEELKNNENNEFRTTDKARGTDDIAA